MTTKIQTHFDGQVAYLTLANPPVNVIDFPMITEIKAYLRELQGEPRLCALVLQGSGRVFSAGVDVGSHLPVTVRQMLGEFHGVFELLDELCVPTVALVRGPALGGACELVGYMDAVIATENARFGVPEIKLGSFPPVAAAIFPQRFGYQGAMQLILTGEIVDAPTAVRVGLVSRLTTEADAVMALEEQLQSFREKSAPVLRVVKRATLAARLPFRELIAPIEQVYLEQLMGLSDAVEGLQAFIEKRDPQWSHR
jgi:cyclohexa-1,5-dienecarbonyl-CoA hydratase